MKRTGIAIICAAFIPLTHSAEPPQKESFIKGADVSFLPQMEKLGATYSDKGQKKELLALLKDHGINTIRLRVWHTPKNGYCGEEQTMAMARRIRDAGMKLVIDLHYSDTWADPGHQLKPAAWTNLPFSFLEKAVDEYTRNIVSTLVKQGTPPDIVQVGNEITPGMLWDEGNIGKFNDDLHWKQFTQLLKAGITGVKESAGSKNPVKTMIHIDCGGNNRTSRWFFDNLKKHGVTFDLIGLSYYPWWHGTIKDLEKNMHDLSTRYGRDIVVIETAHPWFLYNPGQKKKGAFQAHPGYEASVDGQEAYLRDLIAMVRNIPKNRGRGLIYWAPEWIPVKGAGSIWSELTLFDNQGQLLPSINAFNDLWTPQAR